MTKKRRSSGPASDAVAVLLRTAGRIAGCRVFRRKTHKRNFRNSSDRVVSAFACRRFRLDVCREAEARPAQVLSQILLGAEIDADGRDSLALDVRLRDTMVAGSLRLKFNDRRKAVWRRGVSAVAAPAFDPHTENGLAVAAGCAPAAEPAPA